MNAYDNFRYNVVPPLFIVCFTSSVQFLALTWSGQTLTWDNILNGLTGNSFSWSFVIVLFSWALIWLWIPCATTTGPPSPDGEIAEYKNNGVSYYFASIGTYLILEHFYNGLSIQIYNNMPQILGTLNIIALALCFYLYIFAKSKEINLPKIYLFYRGRDLYPKIFGVQVKQLTNCRVGLILWQILPLAFFIASFKDGYQFNFASFTTLLIQSTYLFKFYFWEACYFHTLDIILDRAGYYICWGCLVWVPCFYTSTSYYFVKHPPKITNFQALLCALIGMTVIYIQYKADMEKMNFRLNKENCIIWGKKSTFVSGIVKDKSGKEQTRYLLTSGFWGVARHFNYTLEIITAFSYCIPGYHLGLIPFLYPLFLTYLLVHRVFRDEEKCHNKYGKLWETYCAKVPYRLIPYIF